MADEKAEISCAHCGAAFSAFLHEIAEHNAQVVCPSCGKAQDGKPLKSGKPNIAPGGSLPDVLIDRLRGG